MTDETRRRIRTRVQAGLAACTVLLVVVPVILSTLEQAVPPAVYAALVACAAAITTGATLVTRIMAMPAVAEWIDRYAPWLSANPDAS